MENNCKNCGKVTTNPKFCSRKCSAIITNQIPKRKTNKKCSQCNNFVRHHRSKLCEYHYQFKMNIKNMTLAEYTERECIKKLHPSSKFAHIRGFCRSWNKDKTKLPCYNCGYTKHVELAHIKPIAYFKPTDKLGDINSPKNVVQLCPNCHWEFDNKLLSLAFPEQL